MYAIINSSSVRRQWHKCELKGRNQRGHYLVKYLKMRRIWKRQRRTYSRNAAHCFHDMKMCSGSHAWKSTGDKYWWYCCYSVIWMPISAICNVRRPLMREERWNAYRASVFSRQAGEPNFAAKRRLRKRAAESGGAKRAMKNMTS